MQGVCNMSEYFICMSCKYSYSTNQIIEFHLILVSDACINGIDYQ